jgi:hypothetical protein
MIGCFAGGIGHTQITHLCADPGGSSMHEMPPRTAARGAGAAEGKVAVSDRMWPHGSVMRGAASLRGSDSLTSLYPFPGFGGREPGEPSAL